MNLRRQYPCDKHEGAVLKREEDPIIRKILEGETMQKYIHTFTCRNFSPCGSRRNHKNKNTIWVLPLSLLALITNSQQNYHSNQLLVMPNKN